MNLRLSRVPLMALLGLAAIGPAAARQYTIRLTGTITGGDFSTFPGIATGDTFTDIFAINSSTPAGLFAGPDTAIYYSSSFLDGDTIQVGSDSFTPLQLTGHYAQIDTAIAAPPGVYTYPNIPPKADSIIGMSDVGGSGYQDVQVGWSLSTADYPTVHALTQNTSLPLSGPGMNDITFWQNSSFELTDAAATSSGVTPHGSGFITGTITSITTNGQPASTAVPEPGALTLTGSGLLLLCGFARRRNGKTTV